MVRNLGRPASMRRLGSTSGRACCTTSRNPVRWNVVGVDLVAFEMYQKIMHEHMLESVEDQR